MAAGSVARIIRAPGRIIIGPFTPFATTTFPYGGTEIGKSNLCAVSVHGTPFRIENEATGEASDILEPNRNYSFACFLRAWDDDAVEKMLAQSYAKGATTQHAVYPAPDNVPGASSHARAVILAYIPDATVHVSGVLIYRGIADWEEDAEIVFQRGSEIGLPLRVDCLRDANGNMLKIGRIEDLSLT